MRWSIPAMQRSWSEGAPRPFAALTLDAGYLYLRPRGHVGYGMPFNTWLGLEANPLVSAGGFGGYGGARFALPYVDLRVGARYFAAFRHAFLEPKESYNRLDIDSTANDPARYYTVEAELSSAFPVGPGDILAMASISAVRGVPGGSYVFEETLRVIVDPPWVWRVRGGYVFRLGSRNQHSIGPVIDVLAVPERDDSRTIRFGPVLRIQLSRHFDVRGSFVTTLVEPRSPRARAEVTSPSSVSATASRRSDRPCGSHRGLADAIDDRAHDPGGCGACDEAEDEAEALTDHEARASRDGGGHDAEGRAQRRPRALLRREAREERCQPEADERADARASTRRVAADAAGHRAAEAAARHEEARRHQRDERTEERAHAAAAEERAASPLEERPHPGKDGQPCERASADCKGGDEAEQHAEPTRANEAATEAGAFVGTPGDSGRKLVCGHDSPFVPVAVLFSPPRAPAPSEERSRA